MFKIMHVCFHNSSISPSESGSEFFGPSSYIVKLLFLKYYMYIKHNMSLKSSHLAFLFSLAISFFTGWSCSSNSQPDLIKVPVSYGGWQRSIDHWFNFYLSHILRKKKWIHIFPQGYLHVNKCYELDLDNTAALRLPIFNPVSII